MRRASRVLAAAAVLASTSAVAQTGSYKVLRTVKAGGEGGFDYVYADVAARRLYIPRLGTAGHIAVFDLDTLRPVGDIANASGHGVAVDEKTHHGFASSNPVTMWDTRTLTTIKKISVDGGPDGIMADPFNGRVYIFSHRAPNATVIEARDGSVIGTIDLGGAPEQAVSDGKGHIYVDIEDKGSIAVVDARTMKVVRTFDLGGKGGECAGLAIDVKNNVLFATCRQPQTMVILNASDGKILDVLPIGAGSDGAVFNPRTMEAFSSQGDGTLTIVKESSPANFAVEQTLQTMQHAKTLTLDSRTNRLLLIAAEFTQPPPPSPGQRPGRGTVMPETFSILAVGK